MGWIILIIIVLVVANCESISDFFEEEPKQTTSSSNRSQSSKSSGNLQIDIMEGKIEDLKVWKVRIKGPIKFRYYSNNIVAIRVEMVDKSSGKEMPVVCQLEELSATDVPIFQYVTDPMVFDAQSIQWNAFTQIVAVPIDALVFPYKGNRNIVFRVTVLQATSSQLSTIRTLERSIRHEVTYVGYAEGEEKRKEFNELVVKTAVEIAYIDGNIAKEERSYLKDKVINKLSLDETEKKRLTTLLNKNLSTIEGLTTNPHTRIKKLTSNLLNAGDKKDISMAMEIFLNLVSADEQLDAEEEKIIQLIASQLNISDGEMKKLKSRFIPVKLTQGKAVDTHLDLSSHKTADAKRKYLREEYKKWNALTTSSDSAVRTQAQSMLKLIAIERAKLKTV